MASTLASLSTRVSQTLLDTGSAIWAAAAVTEGIRTALGEYNFAAKIEDPAAVAVTLNGLDGAAATTLPADHDTPIVWGACAYCVQARAVDRADSLSLGADAVKLKAWGDDRLREFKIMLGTLFPAYLVAALSAGSGGGTDPALSVAQIALLTAQAAHLTGEESREAAAAVQAAADRAAEAARLADLRAAIDPAWGSWADDV